MAHVFVSLLSRAVNNFALRYLVVAFACTRYLLSKHVTFLYKLIIAIVTSNHRSVSSRMMLPSRRYFGNWKWQRRY